MCIRVCILASLYIYRVPMANTIASCVGSKDIQSMLSCPISVGKQVSGTLAKFNRKEVREALRSDPETGMQERKLRRRRGRSSPPSAVGPSPSDLARQTREEDEEEEEEEEDRERDSSVGREERERATSSVQQGCLSARTALENVLSYCLLPYVDHSFTCVCPAHRHNVHVST